MQLSRGKNAQTNKQTASKQECDIVLRTNGDNESFYEEYYEKLQSTIDIKLMAIAKVSPMTEMPK